jgi:hypothetical protein
LQYVPITGINVGTAISVAQGLLNRHLAATGAEYCTACYDTQAAELPAEPKVDNDEEYGRCLCIENAKEDRSTGFCQCQPDPEHHPKKIVMQMNLATGKECQFICPPAEYREVLGKLGIDEFGKHARKSKCITKLEYKAVESASYQNELVQGTCESGEKLVPCKVEGCADFCLEDDFIQYVVKHQMT